MPTGASSYAHTGTPTMVVSDARGLLLRTVQFHRREAADPVDTRVTEQRFDGAGRLAGSRDPYLFDLAHTDASAPFNLSQVTSLSGGALMTDSVDAGWRVVLPGGAGQPLEHWDGRGSHSLTEYDELLRPVAVHESGREVAEHTLERFTYADASAESAARNLCGQLIRHDDPAGTVHFRHLNITGNVLSHTRKFLTGTDAPDWPADVVGRDALLEPGDGATTAYTFAPGSELLSQTDAFGNVQAFAYTLAGQLKNTRLTLAGAGQVEKLLVHDIRYNVTGQIESETAGNGVITRHRYDEANDRLTELSAHKADGTPLQDLKYHYDAAGNVLSIEDAAQPIRYFANQRIEALKTYRYDTLDQLIEATGCEAKTGSGGPALPDFQALPLDPSQIANYTQTFYYDAGGNLRDLVHVGAQAHGRTLTRARYSNRCLPDRDNRPPTEEELANGFDANGNLRELQVGQSLTWDLRNQLREVRPVVREDKEDDCECYIYDGGGQRVRKVRSSLTNARAVLREVRYLPGVEVRSHSGSGEILHVISASSGSNSVQVLHWVSAPPDQMAQNQVRYSLNDHLKSSALEQDQNANLINLEWYYSYGGTACWAGRNATEAKYKTVRYSAKERDATGLYYYGFRYYAPWLQRWINPDPAGYGDGMNLFLMVHNNPVNYQDARGLCGTKAKAPSPKKCKNITSAKNKLAAMQIKKQQFHAENLKNLEKWKNIPDELLLVHTLKLDLKSHENSELLSQSAASLFSNWDIISTSLIRLSDRSTATYTRSLKTQLSGFDGMTFDIPENTLEHYSQSEKITFGEIAFKLRVPAANIIGTIPFDNGFPNQTGRNAKTIEEKGSLAKAFHDGQTKLKGEKSELNTYYSIVSPEQLIKDQREYGDDWNEVLIVGRKDVSIHPGFPNTGDISVEEIFILPQQDIRLSDGKPILPDFLQEAAERIKIANPGIPITIK
jgi:insecticidal toxin complex protein TccC